MKHLDLFSGIGGFALASSWVWGINHEIVSFCEIDPFCQKILKKHWPKVHINTNIKTMKGDHCGRINLLTGGFPCQPYSNAGKRRGKDDDRALWCEMFRIIKEANPRWIIGENVAGFINMELDDCLSDLESEGYETTAFIIPACAVQAQHQRKRVWIIAHSEKFERNEKQTQKAREYKQSTLKTGRCNSFAPHSNGPGLQKFYMPSLTGEKRLNSRIFGGPGNGGEISESPVCRAVDDVPNRVDRIRGLGNAIVPELVVPIMTAIKQIEDPVSPAYQGFIN